GRLAEVITKQVPEIEKASTVIWENEMLVEVGEKMGKEKGRFAGPDFFQMFSFPFVQGNPATALSSPDEIVISQALADKYFWRTDPVGKIVRVNNKKNYKVTGVIADILENSSIRFDFILPVENAFDDNPWMVAGWAHFGPPTYVMLRKDASLKNVNNKIKDFLTRQDNTVNDKVVTLQPYEDMYLYSHFSGGVADGGRIEYVRLFTIVAIFILLIACINFMNLTTARSVKRAKEVGVRKTAGASRSWLFGQFIGEAFMITLFAVITALLLTLASLPMFNTLTGKNLSLPLTDIGFVGKLLLVTIATSLISGSYPALFLSSLNPVSILRGTLKFKLSDILLRKGLVVFQFTLTTFFIVCSVVVYQQMRYVQTKNLGINRDNIIYVPLEGDLTDRYEVFKNDLLQSGSVEAVSKVSTIPTDVGMVTEDIEWQGKDPNDKTGFWEMAVDYDFTTTMKTKLKEGRDYSSSFSDDSSNFIINEKTANIMKMQTPVGQTITYRGKTGKIIGLLGEFHFHSLHEEIGPLFISFLPRPRFGLAVVRAKNGKIKDALALLGSTWKKYNPRYPVDYRFADELFARQYRSEMTVERLANIFTILTIFISCMGLFGLAMFMAEQRTKEVSIRKVLGASTSGIVAMLSKDFVKLVVIAAIIAFPLAWWAMHNWLQAFAYKVSIEWWVFALAGLLSIIVALLTVSFQAVKLAFASPVKNLATQ
ncbi:MAG: ABC transporter permease, partial [Chitinophagaceae bacterium]